ncbi:MAG: hypothetical protein R6T96_15310 [Longimicrobiales bacterium]
MAGGTVGWHYFDVESGLVPDESSPSVLPGDGRGRIVVLAATPFSMIDDWAGRAAVTIAENWSRNGLRVFLMDLGLESPTLHKELRLPNREGVSDAFLFGASIQHIASPAGEGSFFFAPAGSTPGDPEEVLGNPRWNDLAGGFSEADATLLLFLPTDIAGSDKILSRATDIVFFSAQGESPETHLGPAAIKVVVNVGPVGSPPEEMPGERATGQDLEDREDVGEAWDMPFMKTEAATWEAGAISAEALPASEEADDQGTSGELDAEPGLVEGSGEEIQVTGDATPSFDFPGDFELAEGFWDEPLAEKEAEPEVAESDSDAEEAESREKDGSDVVAAESELGEGPEPPSSGEFGDDLTMGSSLSGQGGDEAPGRIPDFEAEFVDLGGDAGLPEGEEEFGDDLVQGADFGSPASPESAFPEPSPIQGEGPRERSDELPGREPPPRTPPRRRPPPKKKFPFGLVAGIVVGLGIAGAALGTALGFLSVPGLTFLEGYFAEIPDPPLTLAGPQANEEVLRFSLVLFTYEEGGLGDAVEMLDALRARLPDFLFALVPGEDGSRRVYSLMAGPAYDRIEAENLREPLSGVLVREDPDSWVIRETPRAFYLGERETLAEAEEYLRSLSGNGIEPYILYVTYADGSEAFEVLAGAYRGVADARPLQMILWENGFRDLPLIERRGRLPE